MHAFATSYALLNDQFRRLRDPGRYYAREDGVAMPNDVVKTGACEVKRPQVKAGVLVALTLFGALIGYVQSGWISDLPTQRRWIAQGVFWGSSIFAVGGIIVALCIERFKIRLSLAFELFLVAALILMFLSNLKYWNRVSHQRGIRIRQEFQQIIDRVETESTSVPSVTR